MLCPEGNPEPTANIGHCIDENIKESHIKDMEFIESSERNTFKNLKTWKKSISNLFRHQLSSSKSNDVRI